MTLLTIQLYGIEVDPLWAIALISLGAVLIVLVLWRSAVEDMIEANARRIKKRGDNHQCLACGYDLPGNESGLCPECGQLTAPVRQKAQTTELHAPVIQHFTQNRGLFTPLSTNVFAFCVISGIVYVATMQVAIFDQQPGSNFRTVSWIGWLCVALFSFTLLFVIRRAIEIRKRDERVRRGCCSICGYDLRASHGKCPECGNDQHARNEAQ